MSSAVLSGIAFRTFQSRGLTAELVALGLEPDVYYDVEVVDLVAIENTLASYCGAVMLLEDICGIRKVASDHGVPVHLDGARIFNASVASGVPVAEYAAEVDTVMFCVSKGLGAPIGSLLCGPAELMREARRLKILFGGAWRQAGVIAAAGLVALEEGPKRLHEDHERARRLAEAMTAIAPGSIDPASVETNMLYVDTNVLGLDALEVTQRLKDEGVGATFLGGKVRMVTHVDVDDEGIRFALAAWRKLAAGA
jgi:threonine aldolase